MVSNVVEFYSDDVARVRKGALAVLIVKYDVYVMIVHETEPIQESNWVLNTYVASDTSAAYNKWLHWIAKMCKKSEDSKYFAKYETCPSFTNGYVPVLYEKEMFLKYLRNRLNILEFHEEVTTDKTLLLKQHEQGLSGSCTLGPKATLMCPKCYALYPIKQFGAVAVKTEKPIDILPSVRYHIQCAHCDDVEAVCLDSAIADSVSVLNKLGYTTEQCCSGHEDDRVNPAFVKFSRVCEFETLPAGWKLEGVFLRACSTDHTRMLTELNNWVVNLRQRRD